LLYLFIPHVILLMALINYKICDDKKIIAIERIITVIVFSYLFIITTYFQYYARLDDATAFLELFILIYAMKFFASDYIKYYKKKEDLQTVKKTLNSAIVYFLSFVVIYIFIVFIQKG